MQVIVGQRFKDCARYRICCSSHGHGAQIITGWKGYEPVRLVNQMYCSQDPREYEFGTNYQVKDAIYHRSASLSRVHQVQEADGGGLFSLEPPVHPPTDRTTHAYCVEI